MNIEASSGLPADSSPAVDITVTINFVPIAHLEEKQYFRLLSLQLVSQIAKRTEVQQPLNLPISNNCREFCRLLKHLAELDINRFTLVTDSWDRLPEPRKQKFLGLFQPSKSRRCPPKYKKKFKLVGFDH